MEWCNDNFSLAKGALGQATLGERCSFGEECCFDGNSSAEILGQAEISGIFAEIVSPDFQPHLCKGNIAGAGKGIFYSDSPMHCTSGFVYPVRSKLKRAGAVKCVGAIHITKLQGYCQ